MNWVAQSLRHYWRQHLGFALAVSLACAVLLSGLMVGDSLTEALTIRTEKRVGPIDHRLSAEGRWFSEAFIERLSTASNEKLAPLFSVSASAKSQDERITSAQIMAVDKRLWGLGSSTEAIAPGEVILNTALAKALNVGPGDSVIFRFERPDAIPSDSVLRRDEALTSLRLTVKAVRSNGWPYEMDLYSSGQIPFNAFISLDQLDKTLGWRPLNTVLFDCNCDLSAINASINQAWELTDAQIVLTEGPLGVELRSERVLIEPSIAAAALSYAPQAHAISSWFIDEAKGPTGQAAYFFATADSGGDAPLSDGLEPTDIAISHRLAARLGVDIGDTIPLRFPVLGPRRQVDYAQAELTVTRLFTVGENGADSSLMPGIPGMVQADSCGDWDVGLPIDLNRIVPDDEAFWATHGGAPNILLSMNAAESLWATPYGTLTGIRFPSDADLTAVRDGIESQLQPKQFGFFAESIGERMNAASAPVNDFGQLFLGFNFFLLLAATFLMALFSGLALEQRRKQQGMLMAIGFTPVQTQRLLLREFGLISLAGCILGSIVSVGLTTVLLHGLKGPWRDAVGSLELPLQIEPSTLMIGTGIAWLISMATARWTIRSTLSENPWFNLRGDAVSLEGISGRSAAGLKWVGWGLVVTATAIAIGSEAAHGPMAAMVFFGCGALVLAGCLTGIWTWLRAPQTGHLNHLNAVAASGLRVRPKSSFAVVSAVAIGLYLVGGVGGGTLQPDHDPSHPKSGTGGYAWMAETAIPLQADLSTSAGLSVHGLGEVLEPSQILGLSVFAGDDASCMNLGSAQTPRLMGVNPSVLLEHNRFHFIEPSQADWSVLADDGAAEIPVVGDAATVYWGLHLNIGDTIDMIDEYGEPFRLRIAGVVDNWVFQGALIGDRSRLATHFPSQKGDRTFLIHAKDDTPEIRADIDRHLADYGVRLQNSATVLDGYQRVERTYMLIFGTIGGLGVILAVVGVVVLFYRRIVETYREGALLHALGFTDKQIRRVRLVEMLTLMLSGVACGVISTIVSLLPRLIVAEWTALFVFLILVGAVSLIGSVGVMMVALIAERRTPQIAIHRNA